MTEREQITLTGAQETMLATLYGRALESRSANPILGDTEAEKAVQRLDYDFSRTKIRRSTGKSVATRAKTLDRWVGRLLSERPDSTVLHLAWAWTPGRSASTRRAPRGGTTSTCPT